MGRIKKQKKRAEEKSRYELQMQQVENRIPGISAFCYEEGVYPK